MDYLLVQFESEPVLEMLADFVPSDVLLKNGRTYHYAKSESFYDWLFDDEGNIRGLELHVSHVPGVLPHSELCSYLGSLPYVEWIGPFPCVWFSGLRGAKGRGLEDWESYYYCAKDGRWAALFATHFLSRGQADQLEAAIESNRRAYGSSGGAA